FRMLPALFLFVAEIIQHRKDALRLSADTVFLGLVAVGKVHKLTKKSIFGKSMLEIAVKDCLRMGNQLRLPLGFAILQRVVGVEQYPSYKADFRGARARAVGRAHVYT